MATKHRQKTVDVRPSQAVGSGVYNRLKKMENIQKIWGFFFLIFAVAGVFLGWTVWKTQSRVEENLRKQTRHLDRITIDGEQVKRNLNDRIEQAHEALRELNMEAQADFDKQLTKANRLLSKTLSAKGNVSQELTETISKRLSSNERQWSNLSAREKETQAALKKALAKIESLTQIIKAARNNAAGKTSSALHSEAIDENLPRTFLFENKFSESTGRKPENGGTRPSHPPEKVTLSQPEGDKKVKLFPVVINGDSLIVRFKKGPTKKRRVEISGSGYVGTVFIPNGYIADVSGTVNGGIFIVSSELNGKIREKLVGSANIWELKTEESLFQDLRRALTR